MDELEQFQQYGIIEKNNIALVSSRMVAEKFEKEHKHVLESIKKLTEPTSGLSEKFGRSNFWQSSYKNEQNKKQPEYLLTRDGFSILVMGFTGKKAIKFKEDYINAFNQMESFIRNLLEAKADFPEFTDAIMGAHEEPKHYHFSNELNMINQIVTGMTAKQFKESHGIDKAPSIRPYLTPGQLEAVKALQRIDIGLIVAIPDYYQRRAVLEQQYKRISRKLISA